MTDNTRRFEEIEGVVKRIDEKSLFFRESNAGHDICIPLSQVENADDVEEHQNYISVSKWFLNKLDDEGRR
jgi:hypothetical protein